MTRQTNQGGSHPHDKGTWSSNDEMTNHWCLQSEGFGNGGIESKWKPCWVWQHFCVFLAPGGLQQGQPGLHTKTLSQHQDRRRWQCHYEDCPDAPLPQASKLPSYFYSACHLFQAKPLLTPHLTQWAENILGILIHHRKRKKKKKNLWSFSCFLNKTQG